MTQRCRSLVVTLLLAGFAAAPSSAQQADPEPLPRTNQEIFAPLRLPDPDAVRTARGTPGPEYWQQRADYRIEVALEPASHRVTGAETITYTNHSPDALPFLWVQLEQNLFRPGSRGALLNAGDRARWRGAFPDGGFELGRVAVVQDGRRYEPAIRVDGTRMRVDLARPMDPHGDRLELEIAWTFVVPEYGADRMGRLETERGWVYELAQWYPRMYVYDDVNGWNHLPYLGQGEFYLEYGDFEVEIVAPRDVVVVAGGELTNPDEVLTDVQLQRWRRAHASSEPVPIVAPHEVGTPASRPEGYGPLTWRFRLENARDFSWAASRAFIWDAASWEGILLQSAYPHEGLGDAENPGWERSTEYLLHTIPFYSEQWLRFPYPVAVNVAGVVGGMEYPGIVFCSVRARGQGLFGVTDHEFGHNWFPMVVGSDERRHAWMDEGFNTFLNHYSNRAYYGPDAARTARTSGGYVARRMLEPVADQPILTRPDLIRGEGLGFLAYRKPGFGLILLREVVLGPERFDAAFRAYVDAWAFKHPQPSDFYRMMEDGAGEDLAWFWRGWIESTEVLDQSVSGVEERADGVVVHLHNDAGLVMPVLVEVELADGRTLRRHLPVEVWIRGDDYELWLEPGTEVVGVTLDPDGSLPDVDRSDNAWKRAS